MDKILRNTLIGGIALISISFAYYFVVFLPQKDQVRIKEAIEENLSKERDILTKCGEISRISYKAFQEEWNRTHETKGYSHFIEMTTHFNKGLNLCVYEGGVADSARWEIHIFNAYTNEILESFVSFDEEGKMSAQTRNWYSDFKGREKYFFEKK